MEIVLMRHAEAESGAAYVEDSMRPLSARGKQVHGQVARELQQRGFSPDVILCSPRHRAEQTAWITAHSLPGEVPVIEVSELDGGHSLESLLGLLESYLDCGTVACVGHEPDMTFWSQALLDDQQRQVHGFATSAAMSIEFDGECEAGRGRCRYYLSADELLL